MKEEIAAIICAYVRNNSISPDQLPALIASVNEALSTLGQPPAPAAVALSPAVSVRRSISPDKITCLDCGWSGQMVKRHLTSHGMTTEQYRAKWKLPADYPMVAPNYASRRSELAKQIGLGKRRSGRRRGPA